MLTLLQVKREIENAIKTERLYINALIESIDLETTNDGHADLRVFKQDLVESFSRPDTVYTVKFHRLRPDCTILEVDTTAKSREHAGVLLQRKYPEFSIDTIKEAS